MTAKDLLELPHDGPCELVRGDLRMMRPFGWRHGRITLQVACAIEGFVEVRGLGRTVCGVGLVTERNPDTVRLIDVMYYSYMRLPEEEEPEGYAEAPPEIVWDVPSPDDLRTDVLARKDEYLNAGVLAVCVVDPQGKCLTTYRPDSPEETISMSDVWRELSILPGFEMPVAEVFRERRGS